MKVRATAPDGSIVEVPAWALAAWSTLSPTARVAMGDGTTRAAAEVIELGKLQLERMRHAATFASADNVISIFARRKAR